MADNYFKITIDGTPCVIDVAQATSRELHVDNKIYIVPAGVVDLIRQMAGEIEAQQQRRISTDQQIDLKISGRVDRMLKKLSACGMLADSLDAPAELPPGVEVDGGTWTFFDNARKAARDGLQNEYKDALADDIGTPNGVIHRK